MSDAKCKLLQIALNGWHGEGDKCRVSFYTYDLDHCLKDALDGCILLDKRNVEPDRLVHGVVSGPMVDVSLPDDAIDSITDKTRKSAGDMAPMMGGLFKVLANAMATEKPTRKYSSFDKIALNLYVDYWRALGALVGIYKDGKVTWQ